MENRNQTTRKNDRQNAAGFSEMVCISEYHFASQDAMTQEAIQRPDIFLECCRNLFRDMISSVHEMPHHRIAPDLAEAGFLLFCELELALIRGVFSKAFMAAHKGAEAARLEERGEAQPKN